MTRSSAEALNAVSPILAVKGLKAYYQMTAFGVTREVRAVDDVTFQVDRSEIYGLAGESSSGKTTLIKTVARAIKPPLTVVAGAVEFAFRDGLRDIYRLDAKTLS